MSSLSCMVTMNALITVLSGVQYEEALEQATAAATNEEKAIWLAKAIETKPRSNTSYPS